MNKFASFAFNEDDRINKLTESYPLAAGTNVFVSEGKVLVQYQDGEEQTPAVKVVILREDIRKLESEKAIIVHSNKVNQLQIADTENRVNVAQAEMDRIQKEIDSTKRGSTKLKEDFADAEATYKDARGRLREFKSILLTNNAEIVRLDTNIDLFKEQIAGLSA
jgi:chromosome segregation ATPase